MKVVILKITANVLRTPEEPKKVERNALFDTNIPKVTNDLDCLKSLAFLVCAVISSL
jgi:hypothetical protein